jgi:hypothetical protein
MSWETSSTEAGGAEVAWIKSLFSIVDPPGVASSFSGLSLQSMKGKEPTCGVGTVRTAITVAAGSVAPSNKTRWQQIHARGFESVDVRQYRCDVCAQTHFASVCLSRKLAPRMWA